MSLPEARLVLWRDEVRNARHELLATSSRAHAITAAMSGKPKHLAEFEEDLRHLIAPLMIAPPRKASRAALGGFFAALGVPSQS